MGRSLRGHGCMVVAIADLALVSSGHNQAGQENVILDGLQDGLDSLTRGAFCILRCSIIDERNLQLGTLVH